MVDDEVVRRLNALEERTRPTPMARLVDALEKLVIPVVVAILAWAANNAATQIGKGQLALARSQQQREQQEILAERQIKYLGLLYPDLKSKDQDQQIWALGLLLRLDPDTGKSLAYAVLSNPENSKEVRAKARDTIRTILKYGPLSNYTVRMLCSQISSDHNCASPIAKRYADILEREGFPGIISLKQEPSENVYPMGNYQIIYEGEFESEPARYLKRVLDGVDSRRKFELHEVTWPSPGVVSVVFPAK